MTRRLQVYETAEITVTFDPNVCQHSGACRPALPGVFDVRRPRRVQPEAAQASEVGAAIQRCPSGALQYYRNVTRNPEAATQLAWAVLRNRLAVIGSGTGERVDLAQDVGAGAFNDDDRAFVEDRAVALAPFWTENA